MTILWSRALACCALALMLLATTASTPVASPQAPPEPVSASELPKSAHSPQRPPADPNGLLVLVNKLNPLPSSFAPSDLVSPDVDNPSNTQLRAPAAAALHTMLAAITAETGLRLQVVSGYRSFGSQQKVHADWIAALGVDAAELTSARPGYSEHQTGLAVDVDAAPSVGCALAPCWGATPHAVWLRTNCWRFGFIVRYPEGGTAITGYEFEPYHLRYVGPDAATSMHNDNIEILETYLGAPPAPSY